MKTKIKSYGDEATDFLDKEVAKVDSYSNCLAVISLDSACNCLALISLDSALKKDGNYYPQMSLKERKYIEKEKSGETYYC